MLILCVGMYRACSTWQYGVVGELIERHRGGLRLGFVDGVDFAATAESTLDESRWSVLKAHDAHERFAERLSKGQALGIYSHRDLRDVAFSWMHKVGLGFDEVIKRRYLEHFLRNDRFWRGQAGMLFQSYEELIAEPARGVAEIARHLGISLEPGEDRAIADLHSFEANRKRTAEISERLVAEGIGLDPKDQTHHDPHTILHWNHLRDGRAGTWRELATTDQEATLTRICGPWLVQHGYDLDPDGPILVKPEPEPFRETLARVSYAPDLEDILLDRMFRGRKGTYLDIGANHPTVDNSTYYFYLRGWRGVNVEPVRSAFALYQERRPVDLNLQAAVSDVEQDRTFHEVAGRDALSTLRPEVAEAHRAEGFRVVEHVLPTRTVAGLIDEHGLVPPDLVSIDVEGAEEQVLRGIPLATWKPKVFVIGTTRASTGVPCHEAWEPILLEHGYLFAAADGGNRFYLRGDQADALHHFDRPVDATDGYVKADALDQRERADLLQGFLDEERRQGQAVRVRLAADQAQVALLNAELSAQLEARHRDYTGWLNEREGRQADRQAAQSERDAWQAEREGWQVARDAWQAERGAWQAEREGWRADRQAALAGRDELDRRVEELDGRRDALAREVDSLHGVIGRLQAEILARDVDLDRTMAQLRPYLKIDRLGVVTALQRKVHSHRAHPKV